MTADFRPDTPIFAGITYGTSVLSLLSINCVLIAGLITGPANTFAAAILVINLAVFAVRAIYVLRHHSILFNETNYRSTDQATGAERVGFYVLVAVSVNALVEQLDAASDWGIDTSLGELGQAVMLLAVTAPTVTYITAGHGKMRRIVREQTQQTSVRPATANDPVHITTAATAAVVAAVAVATRPSSVRELEDCSG